MHTGFRENAEWTQKVYEYLNMAEAKDGKKKLKDRKLVVIPLAKKSEEQVKQNGKQIDATSGKESKAVDKKLAEKCEVLGPKEKGHGHEHYRAVKYKDVKEPWIIQELYRETRRDGEDVYAKVTQAKDETIHGHVLICTAAVMVGCVRTANDKVTHHWAVTTEQEWSTKMGRGRCSCGRCEFDWFVDGWQCSVTTDEQVEVTEAENGRRGEVGRAQSRPEVKAAPKPYPQQQRHTDAETADGNIDWEARAKLAEQRMINYRNLAEKEKEQMRKDLLQAQDEVNNTRTAMQKMKRHHEREQEREHHWRKEIEANFAEKNRRIDEKIIKMAKQKETEVNFERKRIAKQAEIIETQNAKIAKVETENETLHEAIRQMEIRAQSEEVRKHRTAYKMIEAREEDLKQTDADEMMEYAAKMCKAIPKLQNQAVAKKTARAKEEGEQSVKRCPVCLTDSSNVVLDCGHILCRNCWSGIVVRSTTTVYIDDSPRTWINTQCPICKVGVDAFTQKVYL